MFLERIVATKQAEITELSRHLSLADEKKVVQLSPCRSFTQALIQSEFHPALIAEVKPASPSKGVIRKEVDPVAIAQGYEAGGAAAISVLTESSFFKASTRNLTVVKPAVSIPVLRKDFILDPLQVLESRLLGADAILLIAALLTPGKLRAFTEQSHELGMEVLLEIHSEEELSPALQAGADIIGVNNRNLTTLVIDLHVTEKLCPQIPHGVLVVGESGIHSYADYTRMKAAGVTAVLVGEHLMREEAPEKAVRYLLTGVGI